MLFWRSSSHSHELFIRCFLEASLNSFRRETACCIFLRLHSGVDVIPRRVQIIFADFRIRHRISGNFYVFLSGYIYILIKNMRQYVIFSKLILVNISVKMIGMESVKLVQKMCFVQILINLLHCLQNGLYIIGRLSVHFFFSEKLNYSIGSVNLINYGRLDK